MIREWRSNAQGMQRELPSGKIVPLCNFQARVLARYIHLDRETEYLVETRYKGKRRSFRISPVDFASLDWVNDIGPDAEIHTGQGKTFIDIVHKIGYLFYQPFESRNVMSRRLYRCPWTNRWHYKASYWQAEYGQQPPSEAVDWLEFDWLELEMFLQKTLNVDLTVSRGHFEKTALTCDTDPSGAPIDCCEQRIVDQIAA
jgi:hypothetical protein